MMKPEHFRKVLQRGVFQFYWTKHFYSSLPSYHSYRDFLRSRYDSYTAYGAANYTGLDFLATMSFARFCAGESSRQEFEEVCDDSFLRGMKDFYLEQYESFQKYGTFFYEVYDNLSPEFAEILYRCLDYCDHMREEIKERKRKNLLSLLRGRANSLSFKKIAEDAEDVLF